MTNNVRRRTADLYTSTGGLRQQDPGRTKLDANQHKHKLKRLGLAMPKAHPTM